MGWAYRVRYPCGGMSSPYLQLCYFQELSDDKCGLFSLLICSLCDLRDFELLRAYRGPGHEHNVVVKPYSTRGEPVKCLNLPQTQERRPNATTRMLYESLIFVNIRNALNMFNLYSPTATSI